MKRKVFRSGDLISVLVLTAITVINGCDYAFQKMSESVTDGTAGINGSFEVARSGLPVNWLLYTPNTVPSADFEIILDTSEFKDGKQSLKFNVRECTAVGGWHSPGFCNEFPAKPGQSYKISFWVMNNGSGFYIRIGGVGSSTSRYETIIKSDEIIEPWRLVEYNYTIPEKMTAIRIELNIIKPGVFWIDDLKIEQI